ncbi:hypothetical protein WICPIJ_000199 [Wickerhamomyces pijperi]|uniref:Uncharacterized protein n=1 Tax=Wickerhamomyces pijperi TaxID=599730 RepID=A0A9P8QH28_WICPI|nr:hypothetical protein WICPIJ_000199 [Wickerhamomyces pijperi]
MHRENSRDGDVRSWEQRANEKPRETNFILFNTSSQLFTIHCSILIPESPRDPAKTDKTTPRQTQIKHPIFLLTEPNDNPRDQRRRADPTYPINTMSGNLEPNEPIKLYAITKHPTPNIKTPRLPH